jgi:hypothetical protein
MIVEKEEPHDVGGETEAAHDQYKYGLRDFLRFDKTLYSFEEDGHAECDKEYAVDQCTQCLGSLPLYMQLAFC